MKSTAYMMLIQQPQENVTIATARGTKVGGREQLTEMTFGYSVPDDQ